MIPPAINTTATTTEYNGYKCNANYRLQYFTIYIDSSGILGHPQGTKEQIF